MKCLDSKKVLHKIKEEKIRINGLKHNAIDLTTIRDDIIDLCEIIFTNKKDYNFLNDYFYPKAKVLLPDNGRNGGEIGEIIEIPSRKDTIATNRKLIINILELLTRAENKYLLKVKLEKN